MADVPADDVNPLPILSYRTDAGTGRRSVRVAQFGNELQAHFVANLLERAGVPAFIFNATANAAYLPNLAPVELHVRPEDAEQAQVLLNDLAAGRIPIPDPDEGTGPASPDAHEE